MVAFDWPVLTSSCVFESEVLKNFCHSHIQKITLLIKFPQLQKISPVHRLKVFRLKLRRNQTNFFRTSSKCETRMVCFVLYSLSLVSWSFVLQFREKLVNLSWIFKSEFPTFVIVGFWGKIFNARFD